MGFRYKYEFDRKRVLIASERTFCIFGYDVDEKPEELVKTSVSKKEIIKYIGFLDDERPQYVLLISSHWFKTKIIVRLLKIKKENDRSFTAIMKEIAHHKQIE